MTANASCDFVIVGGGTAGLVMAARLSENPRHSVWVLEAGSDHTLDPRVKTPAFYQALIKSEADWAFVTEPQPRLNGRTVTLNQGKALGGSSALNAHVFVPPTKGEVDAWEALGNPGWNWNTLQPYLSKAYTAPSVDETLKRSLGITGWSASNKTASNGPIQTSFPGPSTHPIRETWVSTFEGENEGIMTQDPFLGASVGAFSCLASIDPLTKERSYSASAYYQPANERANLHVMTNALVERIVFDETYSPARATGVVYCQHGETKSVLVGKEVIICAGAIQSPKILQLSGIGASQLLQSHGIPVVQNLPGVGTNLQDHAVSSIGFEAVETLETLDALGRQEPEVVAAAMQEYATSQTGLLASVGVYSYAYLTMRDDASTNGQEDESFKMLLEDNRPASSYDSEQQARAKAYYGVAEKMLLDPETPSAAHLAVMSQTCPPVDPDSDSPAGYIPGKFITIGAMLSHPLSRGSVHIQSADPAQPPRIDPGYLSHPVDREILARHLLRIDRLATVATSTGGGQEETPPLGNLLRTPMRRRDPASDLGGGTDMSRARDYLATTADTMWHLAGTCSMLPRDRCGVVDPALKVYGVANVRVADSSVLPLISTANLQATVYGVAERAADLVKGDWE